MLVMYPTPPAGLSYIWKMFDKACRLSLLLPQVQWGRMHKLLFEFPLFSRISKNILKLTWIQRLFTGYFYRIRKNTLKLIYHIWIWTELLDPTTLCCTPSYWSSILPKYLNGPSNVGQHRLWNFHSTSLLFDIITALKEGIEKTFTQQEQGVI